MSKIKLNNIFQDEVRSIIPIKNYGKEEYVIVKNPTKLFKEELMNKIWVGMENPDKKLSDEELLQLLFDKLVNIDLDVSISEIMDGNISYELQCIFYSVSKILQELVSEVLMNSEIILMRIKNNELTKLTASKVDEIEKLKNIK